MAEYVLKNIFDSSLYSQELKTFRNLQICELCQKSLLNFCTVAHLLSIFEQDKICNENITCHNTNVGKGLDMDTDIKDEIIQGVKEENDNVGEFENVSCKNEEIDLKMECDVELEIER